MPEPLSLPPEEMRRLGYAVIDRLVAHIEGLGEAPPIRIGQPEALTAAIGGPPPDAPGDAAAELATLFEQVLPWGQRADHPRFFARIGSPSTYVGALADAAAAGMNAFTSAVYWMNPANRLRPGSPSQIPRRLATADRNAAPIAKRA